MTLLLRAATIGFVLALASAALAQGPGNDREIRERVFYYEGMHLFVTPENGKLKTSSTGIPANGALRLAGDPADSGALQTDSRNATATEQPAKSVTSEDETGIADEREMLDYIAIALLIFIAVWAIAYRRDPASESGGPTAKDRAEALDARLTYLDQRLADIERRVRRKRPDSMVA